nr:MAG TPA: hypothetical protein [Caudoviricetes sp.]
MLYQPYFNLKNLCWYFWKINFQPSFVIMKEGWLWRNVMKVTLI